MFCRPPIAERRGGADKDALGRCHQSDYSEPQINNRSDVVGGYLTSDRPGLSHGFLLSREGKDEE